MTNFTKTFAAALLATTLLASAAYADNAKTSGVYVAGQMGLNSPTHDDGTLDNALSIAGAVGYRFNQNLRLEGEISYRNNDYKESIPGLINLTGDAKTTNFMVNAWYDFTNSSPITPYLGGGIGISRGELKLKEAAWGIDESDSDTAFVWQLGGGVAFDIAENIALTADYRYIDTADFTFKDSTGASAKVDYRAHEIRFGARYSF